MLFTAKEKSRRNLVTSEETSKGFQQSKEERTMTMKRYPSKKIIAIFLAICLLIPSFGVGTVLAAEPSAEGVTVRKDAASPTGYTATFVYKSATAESVKLYSTMMWFYDSNTWGEATNDNMDTHRFSPETWTDNGLFSMRPDRLNDLTTTIQSQWPNYYEKDLNKISGTDLWTLSIPLPSGSWNYLYNVDGSNIPDPANLPLVNTITGRVADYSMVYVPYDGDKQANTADQSIEVPRTDGKSGTISYAQVPIDETTTHDIAIYTPYGYDANNAEAYKTIYMLHGSGGDELDWFNDGSVPYIMDNAIAEGKTAPAIVVSMAQSGITVAWLDTIRAYVEEHYNVSLKPEDRALLGLSAGGSSINSFISGGSFDCSEYRYLGIWSSSAAGTSNYSTAKNIDYPYIMLSMGLQDRRWNAEKSLNPTAGFGAVGANVVCRRGNGSHDWEYWPAKFTEFLLGAEATDTEPAVAKLWSLNEGVTVQKDENSPTGYTATFVYKNAEAQKVQVFSDLFGFYRESEGKNVKYTPFQWERDMICVNWDEAGLALDMENIGNGFWSITLPLPSGGFSYRYIVDGTHKTDPANPPMVNTITGTNAFFSMVYMPVDAEKQDVDRSVELPRNDQNGSVVFDTYYDNGQPRELAIYLPYGYDADRSEPYKVIYLSHGSGGHELDWMNDGCVPNIMDNLIAEGKTQPAIVVSMNNSYYGNDTSHTNQVENIMPYVEANYNAATKVEDIAYCGLSAGGSKAGWSYLNDPTVFGYYGIWSSAQVASMAMSAEGLDVPTVMVGMGKQDKRLPQSNTFAEKLEQQGVDFSYYVIDGAHDWEFWPQMFTIFAEEVLWKTGEAKVVSSPASAKTGEDFEVNITLPLGITGIKLVNETGRVVGLKQVSYAVDNRTGHWAFTTNVGTAGKDRTFTILAKRGGSSVYEDTGLTFTLDILQATTTTGVKAQVNSAVFAKSSVKVNEAVQVTVVTNTQATQIAITNEKGGKIGKSLVSKSVADGKITWVYSLAIGTAGNRVMTFAAAKADGVYNDSQFAVANITVTK